ncbi:hypothetical protein GJ744_002425 [Endocarpon pusillum]|uniref:Uncharacterized protein n=1 Tax=Endocarpon pusillum TaxID=364733 RepID=A0A8H7A8Z6_9EURO|nr:hypothetical protein GJ744_002425 [Endocarpon pusillum]
MGMNEKSSGLNRSQLHTVAPAHQRALGPALFLHFLVLELEVRRNWPQNRTDAIQQLEHNQCGKAHLVRKGKNFKPIFGPPWQTPHVTRHWSASRLHPEARRVGWSTTCNPRLRLHCPSRARLLGQLQRQLKSWSSLAAATNASPGTVQHTTNQPGAQPTRRKRGPPSTSVGGRSQRGPSSARLADQPQEILNPCNIANPKDVAKSHQVQLQALASVASSSVVTSTAQHRRFDEHDPPSQADLTGQTGVCQMTTSADCGPSENSDSNGHVHEFHRSIERQYLKDFLQYIRELMRDLEIIRDLEPHTTTTTYRDNNDDVGRESAQPNFAMPRPFNLQQDKSMLQQDRRRNFAEAEHSKPAAGSAHKTSSTKQLSDNPWPPATILAHPTSPYERVDRQQWRCASPTLFSIAPSSISGIGTVKSTARRAKRGYSVETGRDK